MPSESVEEQLSRVIDEFTALGVQYWFPGDRVCFTFSKGVFAEPHGEIRFDDAAIEVLLSTGGAVYLREAVKCQLQ